MAQYRPTTKGDTSTPKRASTTPSRSRVISHNTATTPSTSASTKSIDVPLSHTPWLSWVWLLPVVTILPYLFSRLHYLLPEPLPPYDAQGRPQPSESLILDHIRALEDIGYRTVGTHEAVAGEQYVLGEVQKLVRECDEQVLRCEWWEQKGSGFHSFNIMDHEVLKAYGGITNIIFRITAVNPPSNNASKPPPEKDAILLGAHIDSTMPSPGASDDGMGVGVMLDIARVLVERNDPFDGSIIFMWNGGEETLQDGSHLYSTQHETAKNVRAMINLEAAGTTGGALLFQATSKEMIEAFAHAPHPRGTAVAADVFSSGIMMSDTDFGQFERYLGVSGLDMAIVGHSYFYHTSQDTVRHIERGSAQHFASNIIGIVDYLLSAESPLLSAEEWSPPSVVYLSLFDRVFLQWTMESADKVYTALAAVAAALALKNVGTKRWKAFVIALIGTPLGLVGGLLSANALAAVLSLTNKSLLWFRHEHLPLLIYVPAGYVGHFTVQMLLSKLLSPTSRTQLEYTHYYAQLVYSTWYMLALQACRIRSAYVFAFLSGLLLLGAISDEVGKFILGEGQRGRIGLKRTYLVPFIGFVAFGIEAGTTTLDIFTPLAGRMGKEAPAEIIVANIASVLAFTFSPSILPLFHRTSRRTQRRIILGLIVFTAGVVTALAGPWYFPYDAMHPKRVGVQYTYNHTSKEHTGHVALLDRGPQSDVLESIHERYGQPGIPAVRTHLTDYDSDWDVFYPVSSFMDTYKFPLSTNALQENFIWPEIEHQTMDVSWEGGLRTMRLRFEFRDLVWPILAFEGEVTEWSFDFPPPEKKMRHHIKIATSVDEPLVDLNLTLKMNKGDTLDIHWSGFDLNQMVPATAALRGPNMPASILLMDMHEWAKNKWSESLDFIMSGVVCGILQI